MSGSRPTTPSPTHPNSNVEEYDGARRISFSPEAANSLHQRESRESKRIANHDSDGDSMSTDDSMFELMTVNSDSSTETDEMDTIEQEEVVILNQEAGGPARNEETTVRHPRNDDLSIQVDGGSPDDEEMPGLIHRKAEKRTHSYAHHHIENKMAVFFSVNLEHGGTNCGILQLSAEAVDCDGNHLREFNEYVNPPMHTVISDSNSAIHGLTLQDPRIRDADPIEDVWPHFIEFIEQRLDRGSKRGIIVAWGGKSCDCEWLFIVTEELFPDKLNMPRWCDYFMDPSAVLKHYKSCKLHNQNTGLDGYGLEMTYCHVKGLDEAEGAHSSMVDARMQTEIILDECFQTYIDKPESMVLLDSVWKTKRERRKKCNKEKKRPVPVGWKEDDTTEWSVPQQQSYHGPEGGAKMHGPLMKVKMAIANCHCLQQSHGSTWSSHIHSNPHPYHPGIHTLESYLFLSFFLSFFCSPVMELLFISGHISPLSSVNWTFPWNQLYIEIKESIQQRVSLIIVD